MNLKQLKKIAIIALSAVAAIPAQGQDLLASQAPIDRKMKAVDSVFLQKLIQQEEEWESPATDLYDDWDNIFAHRQTEVPDSFRIDLRDFCMPTPSRVITSNFGPRWGRRHQGLDIKVYIGDTIRAAFSGKVRMVKYEAKGYGKYVVIRHDNGLETIYGHMSKQLVKENQDVRAGEPIGLGGNTGRSTGSHLHFETRLCGVALNPAIMFDFRNQDIVADDWMFCRATYNKESSQATRLRGAGGVYRGGDGLNYAEVPGGADKSVAQRQTHYHKVKRGETLSAIARKHHTTINAICKLNRINKKVKLKPGQILKY